MEATDFLVRFLSYNKLRAILLAPRLKRPPERQFPITESISEVLDHLDRGGNVGILGGNVAILDFDNMRLATDMFVKLGPLDATVLTGTGKIHCYVQPFGTPARIKWQGEKVGEIQRGEKQYVVCPPSIHPNGEPYQWRTEDYTIPQLPEPWLKYLLNEMTPDVPDFLKSYPSGASLVTEEWQGPDSETLIRRALAQPGAKRRSFGVKFQCPGCRAENHDRHKDNATVFNDGRWGCAYDPNHRRALAQVLNPEQHFTGDDLDKAMRLIDEL